jgi:hypothetical protein
VTPAKGHCQEKLDSELSKSARASRLQAGEDNMRVMVLVKANKDSEAGQLPDKKILKDMGAFNEQLAKAGVLLAADGLKASSHGKRVKFNGSERLVIDGPFPETKELVAGYWIWKVQSMDEAVEWLKKAPFGGGTEVEIRPIFELEDLGGEFTEELRERETSLRARIKHS